MAHVPLTTRRGALAAVCLLAGGCALSCSGDHAAARARDPAVIASEAEGPATLENTGWGTFHSKRFETSLRLPDGPRWRIDDHHTAWLKAQHRASQSTLWLRSWSEDASATRKLCYARAREWMPSLPAIDGVPLIEDRTRALFAGIETRVEVGVQPAGGGTEGFVVAAGAEVHRCVLLAFVTRAEGAGADDEVASRLLLVSERLLPQVQLDQSFAPSREPAIPSLPGAAGAPR